MRFILTASFLGLAFSLLAAPAFADINDIRSSDNALEFDAGVGFLKYGETDSGTTLDTETGTMTSVDAGYTWLGAANDTILSNFYAHIDGQATVGSTHYNGALQDVFGNITPYQSTTNDDIYHVSARVGRFFEIGNYMSLTPYLNIGFRSWYRQLTGIGAYSESYQAGEGMGGLLFQASPMPRLVLSLSGEAGSTLGPQMSTQGVTFNLGATTVWQMDAKVGYALTPRFEVIGDAKLDGFGFGQSQITQGAYEPNSYTHQLSLMAGVAYHLQ